MNVYFVDHFSSKAAYHGFISYVGAYSDAFSLIYFQYSEKETPRPRVSAGRNALQPDLIYEEVVTCWPGTETKNEQGHVYLLRAYRRTFESLAALEIASSLWDSNYPDFPMDLCFYKNGFSWFASSVHEHWNALYTDKPYMVKDLESLGLRLTPCDTNNDGVLFFDEKLFGLSP